MLAKVSFGRAPDHSDKGPLAFRFSLTDLGILNHETYFYHTSSIDVINVQKIIINVYKRVYNDIFTKRL